MGNNIATITMIMIHINLILILHHIFSGPILILSCLLPPRPHIFLDMRTRSANGLLLHITDKHGFARVILFMSGGRVKLFVGDGTLIHYQKKINDGAWHNVSYMTSMGAI